MSGVKWDRYELRTTISAHRIGWRGAFDAVVSAVTGRPRLAVPTTVTISFYSPTPVQISVLQLENGDE